MLRSARIAVRGVLLLAALTGNEVEAQDMPQAGNSVEARLINSADSISSRLCAAPLIALAGDTLVLERSVSCAAGNYIARVRYARADRGVRLRRAGLGMLVGVVAGSVIGRASAGCRIEGCDLSDGRSMNAGTGGIVLGAIGTLIGVAWPVHERWTELEGDRTIRVGAVDPRPSIRVSLDERSR